MNRLSSGKMRWWVIGVVAAVWSATAVIVIVLATVHPHASISANLTVRQVSFRTDSPTIVNADSETELMISGVSNLTLVGSTLKSAPAQGKGTLQLVNLIGAPAAECAFYNVRGAGGELAGSATEATTPSLITVKWPNTSMQPSLTLTSHSPISGTVTAQPLKKERSAFSCERMQGEGNLPRHFDGLFSPEGGGTGAFTTHNDGRLDIRGATELGGSQISVLSELRFSDVEPGRPFQEKSVLLKPRAGHSNRVDFEGLGQTIELDETDLLLIRPARDFYIKEFHVNNGIELALHGIVEDVLTGAGGKDLSSRMPSLLNHLDSHTRVLALIPSIAALVLGILEKMNLLGSKQ